MSVIRRKAVAAEMTLRSALATHPSSQHGVPQSLPHIANLLKGPEQEDKAKEGHIVGEARVALCSMPPIALSSVEATEKVHPNKCLA